MNTEPSSAYARPPRASHAAVVTSPWRCAAGGELARTGPLGGARHVFEEPAELGAREVRIEHEAGLLPEDVLEATRAQLLAERGGAPVLPHDGAVHRPSAPPLPEDGGLALVRDAERRHVARAHPRAPARLAEHAQRDPPDLLRIVLDPPRLRVVLRELRVGAPDDAPLAVDHEHGRTRGPLIDRDDDGHQPEKSERRRRSPSRTRAWSRSRTWSRRRATRVASEASLAPCRAATSSGSPKRSVHWVGSGTSPQRPSHGKVGVTGRVGSPRSRPGRSSRASTGCTSSAPM